MIYLLECILDDIFGIILRKPQLNEEYVISFEDPFMEDVIVKPVEFKGNHVRYLYKSSGYKTGSSCKIVVFNENYKLVK